MRFLQRVHLTKQAKKSSARWMTSALVKVSGSVIYVAWEHANFGGNRLVLMPGTSIPELRHVAGGWHDQITSSKVIEPKELGQIFT